MSDSADFRPPVSRSRYDGWSLDERNPDYINALMPLWEWFYRYYFRVQTDGWHHVPSEGKFLVVGSHNGGLASPDMHMCLYDWFRRFGTDRLLYGLMHPNMWKAAPSVASQAMQCGAIIAHPKMAIAAFKRNAPVVVYPGGAEDVFRPHSLRDKIYFAGRKGFIKLALREEVPIIPLISWGAHDTLIVLADFYKQVKQLHDLGMPWLINNIDPEVFPIYLGLPWGISIGPLPNFPLPVQIHTRVCAPIFFERYGREAAQDNKYVNACYQQVQTKMQQELNDLVASVEAQNH
ncbi:lysophospholipid acyltransferase family protein [Limnoraphis robusta Tam1]|uniref:Lysophospholipid acyltransferase family protein n=1 Tax=Limnoraphis robusta CCNP1315 TaxID=3110306 RepID=A0ABU5U3M1_9CYAN|nr:lysophospholipid acyltransferase family protein [Limnoraphis robusta]MEA5521719.1 lysophospholipid acyltransferase family protein [Limnoraphis robusta CCNP1315]MEA5543170.1 lysophospholipid acyltransferase family protein [Limnoraphis robusta Tam1]MEA5548799.1 lysophospholipid acyltransferase family protein [Limnoraphis robusta CCNP1324]